MTECAPTCSCVAPFYWLAPLLPLLISGLIKAIVGLKDDRIAFEGFCEVEPIHPSGGFSEKLAMFLLNVIFYFLHPFLMLGVVSRVQACEKIKEINENLSPQKMYVAMKDKVYSTVDKGSTPKSKASVTKTHSSNRRTQHGTKKTKE
ncbi:uncharacterized protein LOC111247151 [Varroa destructor]|uniref:Uncharacterized protein n=2 Tax=Varroa TaxID=62624 RepID=A0A7M7JKU8_VARDE|nr:uncharacterized protein LOC111247151 [Varroa destructor]